MQTARTALRWTAVGLGVIAIILTGIALAFPWSQGSFGDEFTLEWGAIGGKVTENEDREEWTWYDDEFDDEPIGEQDGVDLLRGALPVYGVGLLFILVGLPFVVAGRVVTGGALAAVGGIVGLVGAILIMIGIDDFENAADLSEGFMETAAGVPLAFVGMPLGLVAGILAIVSGVRVQQQAVGHPAPIRSGTNTEDREAPQPLERPTAFRIDRRHRLR